MGLQFITESPLSLETIRHFLSTREEVRISPATAQLVRNGYDYLQRVIREEEKVIYGINTGFGALCNVRIADEDLRDLQANLVMSHACGTGDLVPEPICRLVLLLKILGLSKGNSGVRLELIERLLHFYNQGIHPVLFEQGSLGASGDLAPLAHLSLPLLGLGEVYYRSQRVPSAVMLEQEGLYPMQLDAKEGLALLNGTQFSLAYSLAAMLESESIFRIASLCAALSLDAFSCRKEPFSSLVQAVRPHPGQVRVASEIREWLLESQLWNADKETVQDPYAFRCIPQVHGASQDAAGYVRTVVETEMNSVTDNPLVFPEAEEIISGGNFHAQPLAIASDLLAIALSELGSISERRVFQLLSGNRGLPMFLAKNAGLHSGLMIAQYTAASIASQNKQHCSPASVDSIVSSNGQEDHVSMAANAGTKLYRVVENVKTLFAIEFLVAAQAMDFRRPARSSERIENILTQYRQVVPFMEEDRIVSTDIIKTRTFLFEQLADL